MSYNQFMKKIIIISGKQYSGKDTLAKILLEKLPNFKRIGIGDAIKIEYGKKNNLTFEEIETNKHLYRSDLIKLGNWGRKQDSDYWLKNLANLNEIIVPDVRVEHELNFFKSKGAYLIRVESSIENRAKRGILTNANDNTETALDSYTNWNIIVENNSDYSALLQEADLVFNNLMRFYSL